MGASLSERAIPAKKSMEKLQKKLRHTGWFYRQPGKMSPAFFANLLILVVFGLIMLFSASYATGYYRWNGDSYHFIRRQIPYAVLGLLLMGAISYVDYRKLRHWAKAFYIFCLLLLVIVLFMPAISNAHRWINIGGLPTLQVSEIAKFGLILMAAYLMDVPQKKMRTFRYGILYPVVMLVPMAVLLFLEPHYSGVILFCCILFTMMFAGGTRVIWFVLGGGAAATGAAVMLLTRTDHAQGRIQGWLDPFSDVLDSTLQTAQSLYTVGSGGLFGLGIGNSRQKHLWLPEATNDFIFSVLCEELGFVGAVVCICLFAGLVLQGIATAVRSPDKFGAMLSVGITAQIFWQVAFNIAVVTNTIPNTGISLPFFSSGGTSLLMLLAQMGVLFSVNRAGNALAEEKRQQERLKLHYETSLSDLPI